MMACVKGLELIAEMRGDCAVFTPSPARHASTPRSIMADQTRSGRARQSGKAVIIWLIRSPLSARPCTRAACAGMASGWQSRIMMGRCTGTCCASCVRKNAALSLLCCVNLLSVRPRRAGQTIPARVLKSELINRARARRPATSPNTSVRTSTGADRLMKSARKPADHCGITLSTLIVTGVIASRPSNSVSVFRAASLS